jgi:hypothetical protein
MLQTKIIQRAIKTTVLHEGIACEKNILDCNGYRYYAQIHNAININQARAPNIYKDVSLGNI